MSDYSVPGKVKLYSSYFPEVAVHWVYCCDVSYCYKWLFEISFGEMIGCDNEKCLVEWFHFECVQLKVKPKGKWYCPMCRGDRFNVLKSSLAR